jgi:hypothetical protein
MMDHRRLWAVIGLEAEERKKKLAVMSSATPEGAALRAEWRKAVEATDREANALGMQMNQAYVDSDLTFLDPSDVDPAPDLSGLDIEMHQIVSTFPGYHLPHVWVVKNGQSPRISTLDLCGKGRFTLLTGLGGKEGWLEQARLLAEKRPGLEVAVVSIGWRQDYLDAYGEWEKIRKVDDDGAVLVRPDQFVCWRYPSLATAKPDCLVGVFGKILPAATS